MLRRLYKFYKSHYYPVNCGLIGLMIGLLFHFLGILATLFICFCTFVGYWVGKQLQKDRSFLKNLLDRILPPGSFK